MLKFAISLLLLLEPLLSQARPQYFCVIPCPLTKPCNPCPNSCCKYPSNNNNGYDDDPYSQPCPINLTVNCCSDGLGGPSGGNGEYKPNPPPHPEIPPTPPTPPPPPTPPTQPTQPTTPTTPSPQSRSGDEGVSYRRSGGRSNMLTSLFSIPGAVADTFLSGEVTL